MSISQQKIMQTLSTVKDPIKQKSITDLNMVSGLQINDKGHVLFMIEVDPARGSELEPLRQEAERTITQIKGVTKVTAVLTAQRTQTSQTTPPITDPHGVSKIPALTPNIKHIIAVASGKGGVGKSTIAANLAVALAKNRTLKIGLLDADIYGPSQPHMMGLSGQRPKSSTNKKITPLTAYNVKTMSIGFMLDDTAPLIWRGPMVQSALIQLIRDVNWDGQEASQAEGLDGIDKQKASQAEGLDGKNKPNQIESASLTKTPLDVLIVDMPPGTGDAQLTMAQKVPMAGAIIVSTPQDIALLDARKAIDMFKKVNVPILGMIENMSTHICSNCGHEEAIFGHGGAQEEAKKHNIEFLGQIPLSIDIRMKADNGKPIALDNDQFDDIAQKIISSLTLPSPAQ